MASYVLLTGSTGLVGRYLLRDLLLDGHRLAVVVRSSRRQSAADRVEAILQHWERQLGRPLPRPVCLEGDVASPRLGLSDDDCQWIESHCDTAIHNAAVLTFHGVDRGGEPWCTNLGGTQNMLDLCRATGIDDLHYISTAYVCGKQDGLVMEDQLDVGQSFRNDYEHSKFLAETAVREAAFLKRTTIYRPAVIAGDSRTGYTSTYHGIYMYLRLMSVLVGNIEPAVDGMRHVSVRLNLRGDELRNIVPIDWVSDVFCRIFNTPAAHGRTYHLAPQQPITPREITDAASRYLNSTKVVYCGHNELDVETLSDFERAVYDSMAIYQSYDTTDPRFDTSNLQQVAGDLPCPRIDEAMLHRFMRYGEEDRWGKRREPSAHVTFRAADYLGGLAIQHVVSKVLAADRTCLGLDLTGAGGGQWQLCLAGNRLCAVEPGLGDPTTPVLSAATDSFAPLAQGVLPATARNVAECFGESAFGLPRSLLATVADVLFPTESRSAMLAAAQARHKVVAESQVAGGD